MSVLQKVRLFLFPKNMPLWLSFLGVASWFTIFCSICLLLMKQETVEHITLLRRWRRFLSRLHRRIWFFNRKGPFVRATIYVVNVLSFWKLSGQAKKVTGLQAEANSVSTAFVDFQVAPRGYNIFYIAEYDVMFRPAGTEDWREVRNCKNEIRNEKADRTLHHRAKLTGMREATRYEIRILTRCANSTALSDACYLHTFHRPTEEWGLYGDGFTWSQTTDEVNIKVPIPEKTRGRQVSVKCNGQELAAEINPDKEGYPEVKKLFDGRMVDNVFPDSVIWDIDDNILNINMTKRRQYGKWTSIFPGDPKVDPGLLKFFTNSHATDVLRKGPDNMPEGLKDYY